MTATQTRIEPGECPTVGLHQNVPFTEYAAWRAVNNSTLSEFQTSAKQARHYILNGSEDTDALRVGHFSHTLVLEPQNVDRFYCRAPKIDRRTNAGKAEYAAFIAANGDKCTITEDEWETGEKIKASIAAHPLARELMASPGANEVSAVWEIDGHKCKGRFDRIARFQGYGTVVDLKTIRRPPTPRNVASAVAEYGYHRQAAWYLDGLNILSPAARRFIFIFCEKENPFDLACYELADAAIEQGRRENQAALNQYIECNATGIWPGISDRLEVATLPAWRIEKDFAIQE